MALVAFLSLSVVESANAGPQWQGAIVVADKGKGRSKPYHGRSWNELDSQEKQRIYQRHKQFQGWSIEQQRRACIDYYQQTRRIPKACESFNLR